MTAVGFGADELAACAEGLYEVPANRRRRDRPAHPQLTEQYCPLNHRDLQAGREQRALPSQARNSPAPAGVQAAIDSAKETDGAGNSGRMIGPRSGLVTLPDACNSAFGLGVRTGP